jgi:tRNA threonylcarbamoyladenosine biosynthesis protein TsaE
MIQEVDNGHKLATPALDEDAMTGLAAALAGALQAPLVVYLQGDLGSGKTTFARALIQALGFPGRVKSPTYGLLEHYATDCFQVLHLDLYRIEKTGEMEFLGIEDLFDERTVLMIEWPERGVGALPEADLVIQFDHQGARRKLQLEARTTAARPLLADIRQHINTFSS